MMWCSAFCGYLGQVGLQIVLGVCHLRDAVGKGHIYRVKLIPHLIWSGVEQNLNLITQFVRGGAFALRMQDVVVSELRPGVWKTDTVEIIKRVSRVNYNNIRLIILTLTYPKNRIVFFFSSSIMTTVRNTAAANITYSILNNPIWHMKHPVANLYRWSWGRWRVSEACCNFYSKH